jgi:hypothetical protein
MVLRKGVKGEYFMDKLNPKYWDEKYYYRKNFFSLKNLFKNTEDPFLQTIRENIKEEEPKKEKEVFNSPETSSLDKTFLRKRENRNIEKRILQHRLKGVSPEFTIQESLFENLKFSEESFCDRFLKKIKNK